MSNGRYKSDQMKIRVAHFNFNLALISFTKINLHMLFVLFSYEKTHISKVRKKSDQIKIRVAHFSFQFAAAYYKN